MSITAWVIVLAIDELAAFALSETNDDDDVSFSFSVVVAVIVVDLFLIDKVLSSQLEQCFVI